MSSLFSSLQVFRDQFNQGLIRLLNTRQLGAFILCLANATQRADLFKQLKPDLKSLYEDLIKQYAGDLKQGRQIDAVEEDLLVLLKLHCLGFDHIKLNEQRKVSHWLCQFNHLRSFRPRRVSSFHEEREISAAFDPFGFHFNKPFMAHECFWRGDLLGKPVDLFYNKYPFAELHGLCVPEREACLPQFLNRPMHEYIWALTRQLAKSLPGTGFGYNSYGAYASVNHLHFQMFVQTEGLPICSAVWQHNGGHMRYPLSVIRHDDSAAAWASIRVFHKYRQPYNLLYIDNAVFILARREQGSVEVPEWSSGFTWYELSGAMLLFNQEDYQRIDAEQIEQRLYEHSLDWHQTGASLISQ